VIKFGRFEVRTRRQVRWGWGLKHEKLTNVVDQAPAAFMRTLAICLLLGVGFWTALVALLV
jgi:hypothetical protein